MSTFHLSISENMRALCDWHTTAHILAWSDCPYFPCAALEVEFRKVWR